MKDIYIQNRRNKTSDFFRMLSVTNWIIIVNFLCFLLFTLFAYLYGQEKMALLFSLQPNSFFSGSLLTLLTSMFMHANVWHLFFNMMSLFFIGNFVERLIGRKRIFYFYIVAGILAGLFYVVLSYFFGGIVINFSGNSFNLGEKIFLSPETLAVGASGAIFGLVGLLAMLTPNNRVYLLAGPLIAIIIDSFFSSVFPGAAFSSIISLVVTFYFLVAVFSIFSLNPKLRKISVPVEMPFWLLPIVAIVPLIVIGLFVNLPIGNTAHLGGLLVGLIYAAYLKRKYKKKTALIQRTFGG